MEIQSLIRKLVDTHAHLHMPHFDKNREELLEVVKQMRFVLNVSTSMEDLSSTLEVTDALPNTFASVGIHPHDALNVPKNYMDVLRDLVKSNKKVISIGEIGLDYFRNLSPIDVQRKVFAEQLMLANELKRPVVLHIRDAYKDAHEIVKLIGAEKGGIVHAFSGDERWAREFVKLGFKIGVGGPLTYPKNDSLRTVVKIIGIKNIVTETDCPYLPPQQYRGKRNEPMYVYYVFEELNRIFGYEVYEAIWENTKEVFELSEVD
ncbi:MAG: TatD family hydrolase [Fervidobacterium sp.]